MLISFFMFFVSFCFFDIQGNIFCLSSKTLRRLRKNKKGFSEKKFKFYFLLGDCKEKFGGVVNTAFTETIGSLCWEFFELDVFLTFLYIERKLLGLSSKTLRQNCNHFILRVHRNVLRKNKNWIFRKKYKFFIILRDWKENFSGVVNTTFTETTGLVCRSFFFQIYVYFRFFTFSETFQAARQKLFGEVVITAFFVSIGTYGGKLKKNFAKKRTNILPFSETARKVSAGWSTLHLPRQ